MTRPGRRVTHGAGRRTRIAAEMSAWVYRPTGLRLSQLGGAAAGPGAAGKRRVGAQRLGAAASGSTLFRGSVAQRVCAALIGKALLAFSGVAFAPNTWMPKGSRRQRRPEVGEDAAPAPSCGFNPRSAALRGLPGAGGEDFPARAAAGTARLRIDAPPPKPEGGPGAPGWFVPRPRPRLAAAPLAEPVLAQAGSLRLAPRVAPLKSRWPASLACWGRPPVPETGACPSLVPHGNRRRRGCGGGGGYDSRLSTGAAHTSAEPSLRAAVMGASRLNPSASRQNPRPAEEHPIHPMLGR